MGINRRDFLKTIGVATATISTPGALKAKQHSDKKEWKLDGDSNEELIITAQRIEDVKGTHSINYNSNIDTISIKHEAHSREGFAIGAILAAEWLQNKKGVYNMKDVLKIH